MTTRTHKTAEQWQEVVRLCNEYIAAGKGSADKFCADTGMANVNTMWAACKRFGIQYPSVATHKSKSTKTAGFQKFVPVGGSANGHSKTMELSYGDIKISLQSGDVDGLRCVLETLKHQGAN